MSAEMVLELEEGMSIEDAIKFLEEIPSARKIDDHWYSIVRSKIVVYIKPKINNTSVLAEGMEKSEWKVGIKMIFRLGPEAFYLQLEDIQLLLSKIIARTNLQFVLSFQLEKIYACRDRIVGEIPLASILDSIKK